MTITKEQFELFNNNFEVIEITNDVSEHKADLDYEEIINAEEDSPGDFFLETNWSLKSSEPFKSRGYSIISKDPETHIRAIYDLEDIIDFIKNDMSSYLQLKGN